MANWIWQRKGWPKLQVDAHAYVDSLSEARKQQGILLGRIQALGFEGISEATLDSWAKEALATAAIEGEKLDLASVRSSIARRLGMPAVQGPPVARNVDGLLDVMADAIDRCNEPLTTDRLCGWQAALFPTGYSGINLVVVGGYRGGKGPMQIVSGPYGRERVHFEAPPSSRIDKEMDRFLKWFEQSRGKIEPIVRAALAHLWFETLHPFEDGNGRIGRALIDMVLAQDIGTAARLHGMSRTIEKHKADYYAQLERAQKGDLDVTAWVNWFIERFHDACVAAQIVIDEALAKDRFWRLAAGHINDRQRLVLTKLLDAGPGGFEGGLSTAKYVVIAKTSPPTAFRDWACLPASDAGRRR